MAIVEYLQTNTTALLVAAGLLGLIIGSFLNVVIHRLPVMMEQEWQAHCAEVLGRPARQAGPGERFDLLRPRSRCPQWSPTRRR